MLLSYALVVNIIATVISSPCTSNQQCSSCDADTGRCLTECYTGYYGPECRLPCSSGCRNNICKLTKDGIESCTAGCKPGYYGARCSVACRPPQPSETCHKCPQECEDRFCQLGTLCVSGCQGSYYGTNCTGCESSCTTCDRRTGKCETDCGENCTSIITGHPRQVYYWLAGGGAVVVVILTIFGLVLYLSCRMKRVNKVLYDTVWWYRDISFQDKEQEIPRHGNGQIVNETRQEDTEFRVMSTDAYDFLPEVDNDVGTYDRLNLSRS